MGGNVGIGTNSPAARLQVVRSTVDDLSKYGLYSIRNTEFTTNVTSYDKALAGYAGNVSIPAGVTDGGYKIGVDGSAYINSDTGFEGTLNQLVFGPGREFTKVCQVEPLIRLMVYLRIL